MEQEDLLSQTSPNFYSEDENDQISLHLLREQWANSLRRTSIPDYLYHSEQESPAEKKLWYKEAVFYEVSVRAFCDSSGKGNGDFLGLTSRLDYLHNLGVDCLWLLPIYPSPRFDDGYDVADYVNIDPDYGSITDFKAFVNAVHDRSMRVIMDFVPNHTSSAHEWFQQAKSSKTNPYRDYYVWSDTPTKYSDARIIFIDTETANWTYSPETGQYYWHRFYSCQPDLNFENPVVQEEMFKILRFWLDIGVDGFRADAVPYLFEEEGTNCENLPKTHEFLRKLRKWLDANYKDRVLLSEACQPPIDVREYFGNSDEFHMAFHFPVMPRIFMCIALENSEKLRKILEETPPIPDDCQWMTFLRNHDELTLEMVTLDERKFMWDTYAPNPRMKINLGIRRRLAPLLNNDRRKLELAYSLLFTLPGSPIIYYGDEIGMGDNIWLNDRNGVRTAMQWDDDDATNGGFSLAPKEKLFAPVIDDEVYGYKVVNAARSLRDPASLYHSIRHMLTIRKKHASFGTGQLCWLANQNETLAVYVRAAGLDTMLVVSNLSHERQIANVEVPMRFFEPYQDWATDVFTELKYHFEPAEPTNPKSKLLKGLVLEPYQFLWLDIKVYGE